MTVNEAGQRGGLAVLRRRGRDFFACIGRTGQEAMRAKYPGMAREWGKLGGRPRKLPLNGVGGEKQINKKEDADPPFSFCLSPPPHYTSERKAREEEMGIQVIPKRPGRPRAIPERLIPKVLSLYYEEGLGYRAVARELRKEGVSVDWSTIRRIVKAHTEPECRRE